MKGSRVRMDPPSVRRAQRCRNPGGRRVRSVVVTVGVIANPASGRDIRRLVAGASVFGNADKAGMVFRLLAGLGATGVERVAHVARGRRPLDDPASPPARARRRPAGAGGAAAAAGGHARATARSPSRRCSTRASRAIVVLGGDGTHRVVAKACGDVPLCAISTGTNNAFPELRETTVAGLAVGAVATGRAPARCGARARSRWWGDDLALVDVAVSRERFIGARALWRPERRQRAVRHVRQPGARSGCRRSRARCTPLPRGGGRGLHVRLGAGRTVTVAARPRAGRAGRRWPSTA